jgi:transposase
MRRYELTDFEWERISKHFPEKEQGTPGRPPKPPRDGLNGVLWIAKSGAPWRDLPERFGPWERVYSLFKRLVERGVLVQIFKDLNVDADLQDVSLDSTSVKVHQNAAGAKKGANPPKQGVREAV